jgi:hypothetical protein
MQLIIENPNSSIWENKNGKPRFVVVGGGKRFEVDSLKAALYSADLIELSELDNIGD